jgi:CRISPR-associated endonuclease/helicase Cas3
MTALAKTDRSSGATRSLIGHSLDVAHCVRAMLSRGVLRERLAKAAGFMLTDAHIDRLAVLAGLHDMGKATNGFQDRINRRGPGSGHVAEAVASARATVPEVTTELMMALRADLINDWCDDPCNFLYAVFCHHGEPVASPRISACDASMSEQWAIHGSYDPISEIASLTTVLLAVFPDAIQQAQAFPATTRFQHALAGLIMTADWMGSDARWHPVAGADDRPNAARELLDSTVWSGWHAGTTPEAILGNRTPRAAQIPILSLPLTGRLVIIEAPTGTGKTEAAAIWADRLAAARLVDGMYFAVPTRSAATELHDRIAKMMCAVHPKLAHRIVRAIPGMLDTDHPVSMFDEPAMPTWATGSTRRALGAPIGIGTVDQAMLSILKVRHGHLRAWCLSRHLLVIDEVHASDPYMSEIIARLVDEHLALEGYVLLMSATLGETMLANMAKRKPLPISAAIARQYPVVWSRDQIMPVVAPARRETRAIIRKHGSAIRRAQAAVVRGEAVLWIRSTIADALDDYRAFQAAGAPVMLHHSRFAADDRKYLDEQVLGIIGLNGKRRGIVIVATQTCEQSLDIDADLLVTDAVPADVFLQRLGRLHRHRSGTVPVAVVVAPGDWDNRVHENGRTDGREGHGWAWVYNVLAVRQTVEWLRVRGRVVVPDDVREMVEVATHTDHLASQAQTYGRRWELLWQRLYGKQSAERQAALAVLVDRTRDYSDALVDPDAATRLGDPNVDVVVKGKLVSPFTGNAIQALSVPYRFIRGVEPDASAIVTTVDRLGRTLLQVGGVHMHYGIEGLHLL